MSENPFDMQVDDNAWCPGCGNFGLVKTLKQALSELDRQPSETVFVSGIGQAAKTPQYMNVNYFNGLHGRSIPPATGIKASNPRLTVIAESGDGCMYGEGGNHLLHAIRRNPDVTVIVHDNMVYGLTKGQASPTSQLGFKTGVQVDGVYEQPVNPVALAVSQDASFVARAYMQDAQEFKEILKRAILHEGFSLLDVFQPCVSFNKVNTYQWFKEKTYYLEGHDETDRLAALKLAMETEKLPLGVFYVNEDKKPFWENTGAYRDDEEPLYTRERDFGKLKELIDKKRGL